MRVDCIIPTYKPDEKFLACLRQLQNQTVVPEKIIIMNTEESLFSVSIPEEMEGVEIHHIKKEAFDHGGTRDEALCYSDADIILFLTQDAVPANCFLVEKMLEPFADPQVAAVYARQMADPKKSPVEAFTRRFNYPKESRKKTEEDLDTLGIKTFFCSNVCAAYRREVYDKLGGFPKKAIFNEDMIFASKIIEEHLAVYYQAEAKVWHWHDYTGLQQLHRNFDLAVSQKTHGGLFLQVKSESEGIRLVKTTLQWLLEKGDYGKIPGVIWQSGCKYLGYKLGYHYEQLPKNMILWLTMNRGYWNTKL
jgi:rhamnosyltransferase